MTNATDTSLDSALRVLEHITQLSDRSETVENSSQEEDDLQQEIQEYPLSLEFRSDWHSAGEEPEVGGYKLLICTGGPAVQITGRCDQWGCASTANLEHQDWGTPWTDVSLTNEQHLTLLWFAQQFTAE